jgi:hypothetical protein
VTPDELNERKYKLDVRRFALERLRMRQERKFLYRHSTALITGCITLISFFFTAGVTIKNLIDADARNSAQIAETARQKTKEEEATKRAAAETDRQRSVALLEYLTKNFESIYSGVPEKQQVIQTAIESAYPIESQRIFQRLAIVAPTKDAPNVWQEQQRAADKEDLRRAVSSARPPVSATNSAVPTAEELLQRLTGNDRRSEAESLARLQGVSSDVLVDRLIGSLLPQSDAQSYRFNLYAAVVLAKISGKWRGTDAQLAALTLLTKSGNYEDKTFRQWVKAALDNYRPRDA